MSTLQGRLVPPVLAAAVAAATAVVLVGVEPSPVAGIAGAAVLAATGVAVGLAVRRTVTRPLQALLDVVDRAAGGDARVRAAVEGPAELVQLAERLNALLDRTARLQDDLQHRVEEATRDLERSKDDLVATYQRMFGLREALARAEQAAAAGQTAANLAHQIGTPLNLISGYVQMMLEDPSTDPRHAERLRTIEEQIRKVTGYIRTTLEHARLPPPRRDPVFPAALLRRVVELSRPRLTAANIDLRFEVPDDLPWLLGDPVRLELALLNLIKNSLDAMPQGGTIAITAAAVDGQGTRIEVSDSGPGIDPAILPRIFEAWVTTKAPGEGTGLGLSFTREVVIAHGGRIDVHSVAGEGATFVIHLPGKPGTPAIREV